MPKGNPSVSEWSERTAEEIALYNLQITGAEIISGDNELESKVTGCIEANMAYTKHIGGVEGIINLAETSSELKDNYLDEDYTL